jgi:ATP-dependent helicase YprA (DUF1998 family)
VPPRLETLEQQGQLHLATPPLEGGIDLQQAQAVPVYGLASSGMSCGMSSTTG